MINEIISRSYFRKSAWQHKDTGDVVYMYTNEEPAQDGNYKLLYIQDITQVTVTIPVQKDDPRQLPKIEVVLPDQVPSPASAKASASQAELPIAPAPQAG